jgi:hypothetical protein
VNCTQQFFSPLYLVFPAARLQTLKSGVFRYSSEVNSGRGRTDLISIEVQSAARSGDTHNFILLQLRSHSAFDTGIIFAAIESVWSADLRCFYKFFLRPRRVPSIVVPFPSFYYDTNTSHARWSSVYLQISPQLIRIFTLLV